MMRGVHVAAEIVAAARTLTRHRLAAIILWNRRSASWAAAASCSTLS